MRVTSHLSQVNSIRRDRVYDVTNSLTMRSQQTLMWPIPNDAQQATLHPDPLDNEHGSRSISDDDLCAWCRHLYYRPGESSLCRLIEVEGNWPACVDADGYAQSCTKLRLNG